MVITFLTWNALNAGFNDWLSWHRIITDPVNGNPDSILKAKFSAQRVLLLSLMHGIWCYELKLLTQCSVYSCIFVF